MTEVSKFEKLYLLRKAFFPIICIGLSLLLLDVKIYYKKEVDIISPFFFLLILGCIVLLYNLSTLYKILIEEVSITKVYFLSKKKEVISYSSIKCLNREFVNGGYISDVGQISDGYHEYVFKLVNGNELIVSPLCFVNYDKLIIAINHNRNIIQE